jgi:aminomethyltransferase
MVEFAGWEMPVQYTGVIEEHRAVRTAAGLFDVSHMGEIRVAGSGAEAFLQYATPNDVAKLASGQIHYSALLTEQGTYIDDLLVYRTADEEFLVVVNAANVDSDFAHMQGLPQRDVELTDVSEEYALLALQGPRASEILSVLTDLQLDEIKYYRFAMGEVIGHSAIISRTGYTGEDGFELYVAPESAAPVWDALFEAGEQFGLAPAGLGARDTLRLEASMALYGHEIDDTTTPWEAGLQWTVKLGAGPFHGREALVAQREAGVTRRLVGFEVLDRGIARQGHPVWMDGRAVGEVTSGTFCPTLGKAVGMAYVPVEAAKAGSELEIEVRKRRLRGRLVDLPFYRRPK